MRGVIRCRVSWGFFDYLAASTSRVAAGGSRVLWGSRASGRLANCRINEEEAASTAEKPGRYTAWAACPVHGACSLT